MPAFARSGSRRPLAVRILQLQAVLIVLILASLPFIGLLLVAENPLERADAIFVLAGSRASRWLEARDLINEGYAPLVLVSEGRREDGEDLAIEQGARLPSAGDAARDGLIALGVPASRVVVLVYPGQPDNTWDEAAGLRDYAVPRGWKKVIVVTSKLHTRRAGFAMRKAVAGTDVRILMRATRYDNDNPARWWRRRSTVRSVMHEVPALVAYVLGLGS
jgi:uncharacterized SAM-binding protein YcdF (DUF218 family)